MGKRFPSYERRTTPDLTEGVAEKKRGRFDNAAATEEIGPDTAGRDIPPKEIDAAVARRIENNAPGGEEILKNFKGEIDSILTLRMPLKTPEEVKEVILRRLGTERERARKIDANFGKKTPAADYLEKKLESLKP